MLYDCELYDTYINVNNNFQIVQGIPFRSDFLFYSFFALCFRELTFKRLFRLQRVFHDGFLWDSFKIKRLVLWKSLISTLRTRNQSFVDAKLFTQKKETTKCILLNFQLLFTAHGNFRVFNYRDYKLSVYYPKIVTIHDFVSNIYRTQRRMLLLNCFREHYSNKFQADG